MGVEGAHIMLQFAVESKGTVRRSARYLFPVLLAVLPLATSAQSPSVVLLRPDRVWDDIADQAHNGWVVLVRGNRIEAVGPTASVPMLPDATIIALPGTTVLPGLIDAHSHLLLHPYNEVSWDDQVLHESLA